MKKLIIISIVLVSNQLYSQNYSPIKGKSYYKYGSFGAIYSLNTDSVVNNNSTTTYYFNQICNPCSMSSSTCDSSACVEFGYIDYSRNKYANIFGYKCDINENGILNFFNNSILTLKTNTFLNDSWQFSSDTNITCTLTSKAIESFLGVSDSVLTYTISNGGTIKLSKNYGLISCLDFNHLSSNMTYELEANDLINTEKRINFFSVFNQNEGDTIVYVSSYNVFDGPNTRYENTYTRKIFKNRIIGADSSSVTLVYDQAKYTRITDFNGGNGTIYTFQHDITTTYNLEEYNFLNATIQTIDITGAFADYYSYEFDRYILQSLHFNYDECSQQLYTIVDDHNITKKFANNLGITYHHSYGYPSIEFLEYISSYRVGDDTYGDNSFFDGLLGIKNLEKQSKIVIYPNPATNQLSISSSQLANGEKVEIYNAVGVLVKTLRQAQSDSNFEIDISELPKGLYFVKILDKDKVVFTQKVLKN